MHYFGKALNTTQLDLDNNEIFKLINNAKISKKSTQLKYTRNIE